MSHVHDGRRRPSPAAILLVPVVVALVLTLFAWPSAKLEPRDLPIGVAGPAGTTRALTEKLEADDGAFDVQAYTDEAAAREAIEDREVYGAFVVAGDGPKVLTASGASPAVAQALTHVAAEVGGGMAQVEDVVAAPRGAALGSSLLPLVIAGLITGIVSTLLATGVAGRIGLLLAGSVLSGLAATAIVQSWLDIVGGSWAANAAVLSLTVLAVGSIIAGLKALLGEPGIALGALTMILVGNPFSAAATAPELLPRPAGGLGQLLPPGAGANLLRSTGYFDGAAAGGHVAVLAAWTVTGLALLALGGWRARAAVVRPALRTSTAAG
jgi:ABC-2 family transporter